VTASHPGAPSTWPLLSPAVIRHLTPLGTSRRFEPNEVIFAAASHGDSMFVIEIGEVELSFGGAQEPKRLGPGQFFGELALIVGDHTRSATATTLTGGSLRVVDQQSFESLLQRAPEASVELLRRTCAYLLESEQRLVCSLTRRNRELEQTLDYLRRTREDLDATQLMTLTDELTGLYNRRCLTRQSEVLLRQAVQLATRPALLVMDIDRFKEVNDTLGHQAGDAVLLSFADALRRSFRQTDLPCRVGGDEFAVLLDNPGEEEARSMARRLLRTVASLDPLIDGTPVGISCSIGGTAYRPGESWEDLFARADRSLYLAKQAGRNRAGWDGDIIAQGDA
jgi:diguanylate cyclase (GGDEF)-like protein